MSKNNIPILGLLGECLTYEELKQFSGAILSAIKNLDIEQIEVSTTQKNLESNYSRYKTRNSHIPDLMNEVNDQYAVNSVKLNNMAQQISDDLNVLRKVKKRIDHITKPLLHLQDKEI